jgi:glc operon protein GlcG
MQSTLSLLALLVVSALAALPCRAQTTAPAVTLIGSNTVAAAFARGGPLLETNQFKIQAGRREGPGIVEVHARDTDIFHFLEGSATFVTGGTVVEAKTVGPDEIRAKEILGGEARRVRKGDVIVIPSGVPHWFKQVDGPLLYYVVKVTAPK